MSQITPLRQKIKAIETTKKIAHAVRLVSRSSYSKLEKQNIPLLEYKKNLTQTFSTLANNFPDWKHPAIFPEDILDCSPLIIIISSAKGLCGGFNSNLFKYFEKSCVIEKHQEPTFITIGTKAKNFITEKYSNFGHISFDELNVSNFTTIAQKLTQTILESEKTYSSVTVYSNVLKNFFIQRPVKSTIIPIDIDLSQENNFYEIELEQSAKETLNYVAIRYLKSSNANLLFQSLIAETASRFLTMDAATTNAEKFLEKLTLQYNKTRQTLITKEVSELSTNL